MLVGGRRPLSIDGTDSFNTNASNPTFSGRAIGAAAGDRRVVVMVGLRRDAYLSSVTVGGVSATLIGRDVTTSSSPDTRVEAWSAVVPTGTTATVSFDTGGVSAGLAASLFRVTGGTGGFTSVDTLMGNFSTYTRTSLVIPRNGGYIGLLFHGTGGNSISWTNASEYDDDSTLSSNDRHSSASRVDAEGATVTITAQSSASANISGAISFIVT